MRPKKQDAFQWLKCIPTGWGSKMRFLNAFLWVGIRNNKIFLVQQGVKVKFSTLGWGGWAKYLFVCKLVSFSCSGPCFFALALLDMARGKLECWLQALSFCSLSFTHTHTCSYVKNYTCIYFFMRCKPSPEDFQYIWRGQLMRHLGLMTTGQKYLFYPIKELGEFVAYPQKPRK